MNQSSAEFLTGLFYISVVSMLVKFVIYMIYNSVLTKEDHAVIDKGQGKLSTRATILTLVYIVADFSFYLNTAILVAFAIKDYL